MLLLNTIQLIFKKFQVNIYFFRDATAHFRGRVFRDFYDFHDFLDFRNCRVTGN